MTICIMQPYFFPYLGYYQLVSNTNIFIFYNDVNFVERGWINRNYILMNKQKGLITIPLKKASSNKKINEIEILSDKKIFNKILRTIELNYSSAPNFKQGFVILKEIFDKGSNTIDQLAITSIDSVFKYLDLPFDYELSSNIDYDRTSTKVDKIVEISKNYNVDTIYFPPGSTSLYSDRDFSRRGLKSKVIHPVFKEYSQRLPNDQFIPGLSMLDLIMNNDKNKLLGMLQSFKVGQLD